MCFGIFVLEATICAEIIMNACLGLSLVCLLGLFFYNIFYLLFFVYRVLLTDSISIQVNISCSKNDNECKYK